MTKTTADTLRGLEQLRDMIKHARENAYRSGTPIVAIIPDLCSADQVIAMLDASAVDIRKYQQVEHEAIEYDRALRMAAGTKHVGREPDGRDYNELFAILSILPPKVTA